MNLFSSVIFNGFISFVIGFLFFFIFQKIRILIICFFNLLLFFKVLFIFVFGISVIIFFKIYFFIFMIFVLTEHFFSTCVFWPSLSCAFSHKIKRLRKKIVCKSYTFLLLIFFNPRCDGLHCNIF